MIVNQRLAVCARSTSRRAPWPHRKTGLGWILKLANGRRDVDGIPCRGSRSRADLEPARGLGTRLVEKDRRTARCHAGRTPPVQQGIVLKKPICITSDIVGQCVVVLSADRVLADIAARRQMLAFDTGKYTHETTLIFRYGLSIAALDVSRCPVDRSRARAVGGSRRPPPRSGRGRGPCYTTRASSRSAEREGPRPRRARRPARITCL